MKIITYGEAAGRLVAVVEFAASLGGKDISEKEVKSFFTSFSEIKKYIPLIEKDIRAKYRAEDINISEYKDLTEYQTLDAEAGYFAEREAIRRNMEIARLRAESGKSMEKWAAQVGVKLLSVHSWESHRRNCPEKTLEIARECIKLKKKGG